MENFDQNEMEDISQENSDPKKEDTTAEKDISESISPEKTVDNAVDEDFWNGLTLPAMKKKKRRRIHWIPTVVLSVFFAAVGFGIAAVSARGQGWLANLVTGDEHISFTLPVADKPAADIEDKTEGGRYTTEGLVKAQMPVVVSVEIFGDSSDYIAVGQGSGVIISADGYIVTNAHVISSATKGIKVVLYDGGEYAAKVIGSDEKSDIAVLKIPATGLQYAEFGNSDQVNAGEDIVTIGSPAGYYGTVTKGIISGLGRTIKLQNSSVAVNCIQIDAAINPGNSGGPLFNMWGQVIGITSSKLVSDAYEGIGFAISSNEVKPIIEELMEFGEVTNRVKIGISFYSISESTAEIYGIKAGICIAEIQQDCDIANTDLEVGDIITEIDGKDVTAYEDVTDIIDGKKAGEEITCHVYRSGGENGETEFDITFELMPDTGTFIEADDE